jgi:DNA polymerase-3 subunit epsilon
MRAPTDLGEMAFTVVDVETTGFSPRLGDRIVEIATVRVAGDGATLGEYATLVNPLRPVGATHIHGLTAADVEHAPTFAEVMGDVLIQLNDAVMVAHNARFDHDFLAAEFSSAGVFLPAIPSLCTLQLSRRLQPTLLNHKLHTCCAAVGLMESRRHSALEDARVAAQLLIALLNQAEASGEISLATLGCVPLTFPSKLWPSLPASGRRLMRGSSGTALAEIPFLARVVASLGLVEINNERVAPYVDLLDRALEDRQITEREADALRATAEEWGLTAAEVIGTHQSILNGLVTAALAGGTVTDAERRDLEAVARLLAIDTSILNALLVRSEPSGDSAPPSAGVFPSEPPQ